MVNRKEINVFNYKWISALVYGLGYSSILTLMSLIVNRKNFYKRLSILSFMNIISFGAKGLISGNDWTDDDSIEDTNMLTYYKLILKGLTKHFAKNFNLFVSPIWVALLV